MKGQIIICTVFCAVSLTAILPSSSNGQTKDGDAAYYCTAEASGGLAYNKLEKKWEGVAFRATHKFVLRLKFLRANHLKDETDVIYEVTITDAGKSDTGLCMSHGNKEVLVSGLARVVFCEEGGIGYRVNLKNNRYLKSFPFGYYTVGSGKFVDVHPTDPTKPNWQIVPDNDEDSDTPYIEGGACTKIE